MAERKVSIPITADGKQAQSVIEKVSDSLAKRCITFHFQKVVQPEADKKALDAFNARFE